MIKSFRHKGLQGTSHKRRRQKGVKAEHVSRLLRLLASLEVATESAGMDRPGNRLHPLKGKEKGFWAVNVSGNWRIIFCCDGSDVELVDYLDYH